MHTVSYKDCIVKAAAFLQLDDVYNTITKNENADISQDEKSIKNDIDKLLMCANLVVNEIACDYIYLRKKESIEVTDGHIYFKDLSRDIIDVFSLKINGKTTSFRVLPSCIECGRIGLAEILYSYAPLSGGLEDALEWEGQILDSRIVAYGIACEYCLMLSMPADAVVWDKRFKDSLFKSNSPKNEMKVKLRAWQ